MRVECQSATLENIECKSGLCGVSAGIEFGLIGDSELEQTRIPDLQPITSLIKPASSSRTLSSGCNETTLDEVTYEGVNYGHTLDASKAQAIRLLIHVDNGQKIAVIRLGTFSPSSTSTGQTGVNGILYTFVKEFAQASALASTGGQGVG